MATIAITLWTSISLPFGQRAAQSALQYFFQDSGLRISVEKIEVALPFFIRCTNICIVDPSRQGPPLATCERLSFSPLLLDLPFHHCTLVNLRARGLSIDADASTAFFKKVAPSDAPWKFRIIHGDLKSIHVTSERFSSTLDCSLSGRGSVSESESRFRLTVTQNSPHAWPKKLWLRFDNTPTDITIASSVVLSTESFVDFRKTLFGPKDRLALSLYAKRTEDGSFDHASGFWNLSCPTQALSLTDEVVLQRSVFVDGTLSYDTGSPFVITVDKSEKKFDIHRIELSDPTIDDGLRFTKIQPIVSLLSQASGKIEYLKTGTESGQLSLAFPNVSINGNSGSIHGDITGSYCDGRLQTASSLDGSITIGSQQLPFHYRGATDIDDRQCNISGDFLASPFLASLRVSREIDAQTIQASLGCQDLSLFEPLVKKNICGSALLTAKLSGSPRSPELACSASLSDFRWNTLSCLQGTVRVSTNLPSPRFLSVDARISNGLYQNLRLEEGYTTVTVDPTNLRFRVLDTKASGKLLDVPFSLIGRAEGHFSERSGSLDITNLDGSIGGEQIRLDQPIRLEHTDALLSKCVIDMRFGEIGRFSGEWLRPTAHKLIGSISLDDISLNNLGPLIGISNSLGKISAQCHIQSTPSELLTKASIRAQVTRLGILGGDDGGLALGATVSIEDGMGTAEACIAGSGVTEPLVMSFKTPIERTTVFPYIDVTPHAPLQGSIRGDILLSRLLGGWLPEQAGIDAIIGCNSIVDGTTSDPLFKGSAYVRNGRIDLLPTGEVIENIQMEGTIAGRQVVFDKITASDEADGRIEGSGFLEVSSDNEFRWNARVHCADIEAVCLDYAKVVADGDINLTGTVDSITISGSAVTRKALLDLAARFPSDTPEIPVVYLNERPKADHPYNVFFDLSIDGANGIDIRGRGLNSFWTGNFYLRNEVEHLTVDGSLRCQKGTFSLSNKELTINEGTATVSGDLFKDSKLNVIANIDHPAITAQVNLKGSLESPKISIQSTPPLPDTEILSLILFNKEYGDISALQSLQLANTAMNLQQSAGPFGLVDKVKENLGIDLIDFGASNPAALPTTPNTAPSALDPSDTGPPPQIQNDVSIKVGKYISDGVAVTVSKDVTSDANYLGIEAQLAPEISAGAQVGDDQAGIVSLKWKKNY